MRNAILVCVLILAPALPAAAHAALVQDGKPAAVPGADKPDKRPEIAELLSKIADMIGDRKGEKDTDAIGLIDQLVQKFPECGIKDRAAVVKQLSKCFEERRLVREGDPPNNKLYMASAVALSTMAPESTRELLKWIGHKDLKKDQALQTRLVDSLGKTRDKEAQKPLQDLLLHKDNYMVAAAANALSNFGEADLEARKGLFEALLKVLMSAKGQTDSTPNDTVARERYDVIGAPIITALQKLAKHDERVPEEWQRWWNKNKRSNWDAEK